MKNNILIVIILLTYLTFLIFITSFTSKPDKYKIKIEYSLKEIITSTPGGLIQEFNKIGEQSWELVSFVQVNEKKVLEQYGTIPKYNCIFKREKK